MFWENGRLTDMGTLPAGGSIAFPTAVNNRGEVVGNAQNTVPDPTPMYPGDGTQTRAFYWKSGTMQDIGTLPGGTDAAAALINERGQVAGWSYISSVPSPDCPGIGGFFITTDSFIWDKKNGMRDIGGLCGTCTLASDLDNRGQVVGGSLRRATQPSTRLSGMPRRESPTCWIRRIAATVSRKEKTNTETGRRGLRFRDLLRGTLAEKGRALAKDEPQHKYPGRFLYFD